MPQETREDRFRVKCVHFNGVQKGVCEAGIAYDSFPNGSGLPCLPKLGKGCELECDKRRFPTEEEVQAENERIEKATAKMFAGLSAVCEDAKKRGFKKGNGGQATVACPVCEGGTIHYSVAGYNGHRHARCTTAGCVAFME
jgi:hypothetical protein